MKGFLQEYGVIMVVVAVVLGMLAFGKTGYAKSIQDAILGSANHIVETGENVTKDAKVKSSDVLNIEGNKYIVLEKQGNNQALVITASSIGGRAFQSDYNRETKLRSDGQNANTYEGCEIDNYLENDWYNSLTSTMKGAIQSTNIKQASYSWVSENNFEKQETGYNGQVYNTISRHVFLPSVSEIGDIVDLKKSDKIREFLNHYGSMWSRDSHQSGAFYVIRLDMQSDILGSYADHSEFIRPAFVIDLSKVDYKTVGHVDYK